MLYLVSEKKRANFVPARNLGQTVLKRTYFIILSVTSVLSDFTAICFDARSHTDADLGTLPHQGA